MGGKSGYLHGVLILLSVVLVWVPVSLLAHKVAEWGRKLPEYGHMLTVLRTSVIIAGMLFLVGNIVLNHHDWTTPSGIVAALQSVLEHLIGIPTS